MEAKQPDLSNPTNLVTKTEYTYTDTSGAVSVQETNYLDGYNSIDSYIYYDGLGRKIQERQEAEDGNFVAKDYVYNDIDLLEKESLPYFSSGSSRTSATTNSDLYISYAYDPLYRITTTADSVGTVTSAYDDWKTTITDKNGIDKDIYKDAFGNLIEVDEHNSSSTYITTYNYDGLKNLIKITDALGNVRNFTYDGLGRNLSSEDLHDPNDTTYGVWTYSYDNNGNIISRTNPNSQTTNYTYDAINRILTEDYTGQTGTEVTYVYDIGTDGIGRLYSTTSADYSQTNTYDPLGNISLETKTIDSNDYTTSYTYDRQGNQLTITNPDSSSIRYEYGTGGLLDSVLRKESTDLSYIDVVSDIDYAPTGQATVVSYANGMQTTNTYDVSELYRLFSKVTTIADSEYGQNISYTYDNNGNITQLVDNSDTSSAKTVNYTYDDLNRLTSATATNVAEGQSTYSETYSYNAIGNITAKTGQGTYSYEGNTGTNYANPHAVTSIGSTTLTYDSNGNLLSKGTELSNTWDYNNRLTQSVSNSITNTYSYDASGQRIALSDGTTTTIYPTSFFNTDSTTATKHIFAGNTEIAAITGSGENAVIHYTATDHLTGSNITTDSSGNQEELLDYLPFGTIRIDEQTTTYTDQIKFAGQEYDEDTGLSYMDARYYDGNIGRFISQDPAYLLIGNRERFRQKYGRTLQMHLTNPQSLNSYSYVNNNPLKYTDPDGEIIPIMLAAYAVGGAVTNLAAEWAIYSLMGQEMTTGEKLEALVSGSISGMAVILAPATGGGSVVVLNAAKTGAISSAAGNTIKQAYDMSSGVQQGGFDYSELVIETTVGAASEGTIEYIVPPAKVPRLSSGQGNCDATGKGMITKSNNGTINNVSTKTAAKSSIGHETSSMYQTTAGATVDYYTSQSSSPSPFKSDFSSKNQNVCQM